MAILTSTMLNQQRDFYNMRWANYRTGLNVNRDDVGAALQPRRSRGWVWRRELPRSHPQFVKLERAEYAELIAAIERVVAERLQDARLDEALA